MIVENMLSLWKNILSEKSYKLYLENCFVFNCFIKTTVPVCTALKKSILINTLMNETRQQTWSTAELC